MTAQRCRAAQDLFDAAEVASRGLGPLRQHDHDRRHGPQPRDAVLPDQPQVLVQLERLHHVRGDVEADGEEHGEELAVGVVQREEVQPALRLREAEYGGDLLDVPGDVGVDD